MAENLTPAQLVALLNALRLERDDAGHYEESDASMEAREAMRLLLVDYQKQRGQIEMPL